MRQPLLILATPLLSGCLFSAVVPICVSIEPQDPSISTCLDEKIRAVNVFDSASKTDAVRIQADMRDGPSTRRVYLERDTPGYGRIPYRFIFQPDRSYYVEVVLTGDLFCLMKVRTDGKRNIIHVEEGDCRCSSDEG